MAPKKQPLPPAPFEEEESVSSGEETSSSFSGEAERKTLPSTQPGKRKSKPAPPSDDETEDEEEEQEKEHELNNKADADGEESEYGSELEGEENKEKSEKMEESGSSDESDSDTKDQFIAARRSPCGPDPSIKRISSRPVDDATPLGFKTCYALPAVLTPISSSKLDNGDVKKRRLSERVWSGDADEKILRGIIDFYDRQGKELPTYKTDIDGISEFLKSSLGSCEFSKSQFVGKIRRLRNKFKSTFTKHGGSPKFIEPVDQMVFELSKKIWGLKENGNVSDAGTDDDDSNEERRELDASSVPLKRRNTKTGISSVDIAESYPYMFELCTSVGIMNLPEPVARKRLSGVDSVKLARLEEKLRIHRIVVTKNEIRRLDLMKQLTQLVFGYGDTSD